MMELAIVVLSLAFIGSATALTFVICSRRDLLMGIERKDALLRKYARGMVSEGRDAQRAKSVAIREMKRAERAEALLADLREAQPVLFAEVSKRHAEARQGRAKAQAQSEESLGKVKALDEAFRSGVVAPPRTAVVVTTGSIS